MNNDSDTPIEDLYAELRRMASYLLHAETPGQTLQPTELVHEAWLRLTGSENAAWHDRRHLVNQAALIMRRQLIDRARRRKVIGKKQDAEILDRVDIPVTRDFSDDQIESLGKALDRLAKDQPRAAEVINLKYFLGMSTDDTADLIGISPSTVKADMQFARAWLMTEI